MAVTVVGASDSRPVFLPNADRGASGPYQRGQHFHNCSTIERV